MANVFTLDNYDQLAEKINIDELYERKRQLDLNQLEVFKKLLHRVHVKIKTIAKRYTDKCCWYVVPEIILGVPKYNQANCIAYILCTLQNNGFQVKYFHPNTLLISWNHWVPSYMRDEIKKKMGITVNEYGEEVPDEEEPQQPEQLQPPPSKTYVPVNTYRPSGKLVYNEELLERK